jgi:predicted DNA-binding protein
MTTKISITIDLELDRELENWAQERGRSKSELAREALIDWLEDQEDIRDVREIIERGEATMTLEEVRDALGLDR